jgi:hypothetical protein
LPLALAISCIEFQGGTFLFVGRIEFLHEVDNIGDDADGEVVSVVDACLIQESSGERRRLGIHPLLVYLRLIAVFHDEERTHQALLVSLHQHQSTSLALYGELEWSTSCSVSTSTFLSICRSLSTAAEQTHS